MYHAVIANNTAIRTDGFVIEGLNHHSEKSNSYIPVFFIETLQNTIQEGNNYGGNPASFIGRGYYNASSQFTGAMAGALVYR